MLYWAVGTNPNHAHRAGIQTTRSMLRQNKQRTLRVRQSSWGSRQSKRFHVDARAHTLICDRGYTTRMTGVARGTMTGQAHMREQRWPHNVLVYVYSHILTDGLCVNYVRRAQVASWNGA